MHILVTGGTGLVGNALQSICSTSLHTMTFAGSRDCNLLNYNETYEYFRKVTPDYIIHLAANVGGLYKNMNNKVFMLENNLIINYNVLRTAHELDINNVISCLSTCIFPSDAPIPMTEEALHSGPPHHSNNTYAYSKRMLEIHSTAYRDQYGRNYTCIIPTNIYGPHDNFDLENGHVLPSLIHQCSNAMKTGNPFIVRGSGTSLRQFLYSKDLANIILELIECKNIVANVIISPDECDEVSIKMVAETIAKTFGYTKQIVYDESYSDGQFKKTASNKLLKTVVTDFKFMRLEEGVKETVKWFRKNNCY
jgi:GDP-L-fucose synthase